MNASLRCKTKLFFGPHDETSQNGQRSINFAGAIATFHSTVGNFQINKEMVYVIFSSIGIDDFLTGPLQDLPQIAGTFFLWTEQSVPRSHVTNPLDVS